MTMTATKCCMVNMAGLVSVQRCIRLRRTIVIPFQFVVGIGVGGGRGGGGGGGATDGGVCISSSSRRSTAAAMAAPLGYS